MSEKQFPTFKKCSATLFDKPSKRIKIPVIDLPGAERQLTNTTILLKSSRWERAAVLTKHATASERCLSHSFKRHSLNSDIVSNFPIWTQKRILIVYIKRSQ